MKHVALIVLHLPDGRLVMQRRTKDAPISPNKLGFFGGHMEQDERAEFAVRRELEEETSLSAKKLTIQFEQQLHMDAGQDPSGTHTEVNVFSALIDSANFTVHEGSGAEVHAFDSLLAHEELGATARYILEHTNLSWLRS